MLREPASIQNGCWRRLDEGRQVARRRRQNPPLTKPDSMLDEQDPYLREPRKNLRDIAVRARVRADAAQSSVGKASRQIAGK